MFPEPKLVSSHCPTNSPKPSKTLNYNYIKRRKVAENTKCCTFFLNKWLETVHCQLSADHLLYSPTSTSLTHTLTHRPHMHTYNNTHTHTETLSCFSSVFHPLPCPDSRCPPPGPLRLPSPLITTAWPPTLHSARDYPPLPLALPFTLISLCLWVCCFLSPPLPRPLFHTCTAHFHAHIDETAAGAYVHLSC